MAGPSSLSRRDEKELSKADRDGALDVKVPAKKGGSSNHWSHGNRIRTTYGGPLPVKVRKNLGLGKDLLASIEESRRARRGVSE